ncbi:MAG: hypothetical protein D6729_18795 [Deltaproteobacteria bacterium]|nr:MAG: hypothetical protein D6729_18795 [Deltaproteobacteria bacterium]
MARYPIAAVAIALAAGSAVAAEPVRFEATVDRDTVEVGDTLTLSVSVSVPNEGRIESLVLPEFKGLEVVSRSQSTQMSYRFGSGGAGMEKVDSHVIVLRAVKTGVATITPAVLRYDGKRYTTDPITIKVLKAGSLGGRAAPSTGGGRPFGGNSPFGGLQDPFDLFDQFARGMQPRELPTAGKDDLFVRLVPDKREVYLGEQVTLYLQVFSRLELSSFQNLKLPKFDGFWVEDLDSDRQQIQSERRTVNGVPYRVYLLKREALFPMKAGELRIEPAKVEAVTGFGLFSTGRTVERRSNSVTIRVRPLPAEGQPPGFQSTNVGQWRLSADVDTRETTLGQPVTYTLEARGFGNLNALELPELPKLDGFKVYEPTRTERRRVRGGRFGGTKRVEWVLVPTRTGELTIPALSMSVFDPQMERYETLHTDPITIRVEAGQATALAPGAPAPAGPTNVLDAGGLRPLRYHVRLERVQAEPWRSPIFLGSLALPAAVFGLFVAGDRFRSLLASRADGGRRARGAARSYLKAARRERRKGALREAVAAVERGLLEYLAAKTGLPVRGMPREQLERELGERGYAPKRVERVAAVLERCENARYNPAAPSPEEVDALIARAERVLEDLEEGPQP